MSNQNGKVILLAGLIGVALVGLVIVQVILLRSALVSEEDAFKRNANVAISKAAQAMSAGEALQVIVQGAFDTTGASDLTPHQRDSIVACLRDSHTSGPPVMLWMSDDSNQIVRYRDTILPHDSVDHVMLEVEVVTSDEPALKLDSVTQVLIDSNHTVTKRKIVRGPADRSVDSLHRTYPPDIFAFRRQTDSSRSILIQGIMRQLEMRELTPVSERIDPQVLDSVLDDAFIAEGIHLDYSFGIVDRLTDELVLSDNTIDSSVLLESPYRSRLFPNDILSPPSDLIVFFPDKSTFIWSAMIPVIVPAGLFLLMTLAGFVYTIRIIVGQQRFAARLTDFINNMTHEFKTPIATIQLASDALDRPEVREDTQRVGQFNKVIRDEYRRMKLQVDKILQMAVLEEGVPELKREPVDLHEIISRAVEASAMAVEHRDGSITSELSADHSVISGDAVHLTNIVMNLLDNANKYSPDHPEIRVTTETTNQFIRLRISDRGIGIASEDVKQVFDKYFRVFNGDQHDVKGFGLGLSYVKLMVDAHGGRLNLNSALGKGTEIVLDFPLMETNSAT